MASFSADVFIIGAQKSGTTSLAALLKQNAQVCLSEPKEPNYYSVNYSKGDEWYRSCYSEINQVKVDASTTYTMCPFSEKSLVLKPGRDKLVGVPQRIFDANPEAKLIYIIRDPVARMYSNYWHNVKYGYEKLSFDQAIAGDPLYAEMSCYYCQVEEYLKLFPKENILLIKFEDLIREQLTVLNQCERFISVNETLSIMANKNENKGGQYNPVAKRLLRNPLVLFIEKLLPTKVKAVVKKSISKEIPKLSADKKEELMSQFVEDQKKLHETFGVGYLDLEK